MLVNPLQPSPTGAVYRGYDDAGAPGNADPPAWPADLASVEAVAAFLAGCRNDLEAPAIALQPAIAEVLAALRGQAQSLLARMSGSGATCFALCAGQAERDALAAAVAAEHPDWWVRPCTLAGSGQGLSEPIDGPAAAVAQPAAQFLAQRRQPLVQPPGRVDDHQAAAAERDAIPRIGRELRPQRLGKPAGCRRPRQRRADQAVLDRIPGHEGPVLPLAQASAQRGGQPLALVGLLERWVDQYQAAPLLRRQQRANRFVAVAAMHRHPAVAAIARPQRLGVVRMQLAGDQPVLGPQHPPHDLRRAGIARQSVGVHLAQQRRIGRRRRQPRPEHPPDAGLVLPRPLRLAGGQVVDPDAGVGVEHGERRRLLQQPLQHEAERGVLEHIDVVAGMEGVAVVHRRSKFCRLLQSLPLRGEAFAAGAACVPDLRKCNGCLKFLNRPLRRPPAPPARDPSPR